MDFDTAWELAAEVVDLLAENGIMTPIQVQEDIAVLLQDLGSKTFDTHNQLWKEE